MSELEAIERVLADEGYDVLESAALAQKIAQALRSEAEVKAEGREELLSEMSSEARDAGWWIASRGDSGGEAGMVFEWVDGYRSQSSEGEG